MSHDLNFLEQQEPTPPRARHGHGRGNTIAWLVTILLVVVGIWGIALVIAGGQILASALDGKEALERAEAQAQDLQFISAREELAKADASFAKAERGFLVLNTLQFVPWVGPQIQAGDAVVESGRSVIAALDDLLDLGAELIRLSGLTEEDIFSIQEGLSPTMTFDDLSSETKVTILKRLNAAASDLELTEAKIDIAVAELAHLDRDELIGPIAEALDPVAAQLVEFQHALGTLAIAAHLLPEFAGLNETKTHLLLFLNNAEIRPAGGFIGTYGVLQMRDGDIQRLQTSDVYTLDRAAEPYFHVDPPAPLVRYNAATKWFFRDSNWSPDFAVSSLQLIEAFNREVAAIPEEKRASVQPAVALHGVIGFTPDLASALLEVTGPISAGGQTFSADNVFDKLEYQVEFGYAGQGIPEAQRKEILSELVDEMKSALFGLPLSEWVHVLDEIELALEEKQLVLYSADADTQETLERVGWAGTVSSGESDVQMVIDANLASLKSDPAVHRTIAYEIEQDADGRYIGRTSIRYEHTGTFDWKTTRYRTYTRLYVPRGSELIGVQGSLLNDRTQNPIGAAAPVDTEEEFPGLTSFGTFTSVEPGAVQTLVFEYYLAKSVVNAIQDGRYQLEAHKQIGAAAHALTLDLNFGKKVSNAAPPEDPTEWGDSRYRLNTILDHDLEFLIEL